ncbi:MAG: Ig-like domain-containing protein [Filifactoraceae bacterium]
MLKKGKIRKLMMVCNEKNEGSGNKKIASLLLASLIFIAGFSQGETKIYASDVERVAINENNLTTAGVSVISDITEDSSSIVSSITNATEAVKPEVLVAENMEVISPLGAPLEKTDIFVNEFSIQHEDVNNTNTGFSKFENFKLKIGWDASKYGNGLKEGDYFNIKLPDGMKFPSNSEATKFDVFAPDGKSVVAKAYVEPNADVGGSVKLVFTDYVENKDNVKGEVWLAAKFGKDVVLGEENTFKIEVNSQVSDVKVHINKPETLEEVIAKWGKKTGNEREVQWNLRINRVEGKYEDVKIEDNLEGNDKELQGMHYIEGSFILKKIELDDKGKIVRVIEEKDISDKIEFNESKTSFKYNLGDLDKTQYMLEYKTTYVPGAKLKNNGHFISTSKEDKKEYTYQSASSGGIGSGNELKEIKVIKVDEDNPELKLEGAEFELRKAGSSEVIDVLKTDDKGEVIFSRLSLGKYTIKETKAPIGYLLNETPYEMEVTSDKINIETIKNKKEIVEVFVNKQWVGKVSDSVTISLLADGKENGSVILTKDKSWKDKFSNLPKYNVNGSEIVYTIKELQIEGYTSSISSDKERSFIITNSEVVPPEKEDKPKEPKPEPKPESKLEPKPEPKLEPKPESKLEPKPEPKLEPKPESKLEPKPEPKLEPKPEPKDSKDPKNDKSTEEAKNQFGLGEGKASPSSIIFNYRKLDKLPRTGNENKMDLMFMIGSISFILIITVLRVKKSSIK